MNNEISISLLEKHVEDKLHLAVVDRNINFTNAASKMKAVADDLAVSELEMVKFHAELGGLHDDTSGNKKRIEKFALEIEDRMAETKIKIDRACKDVRVDVGRITELAQDQQAAEGGDAGAVRVLREPAAAVLKGGDHGK